MKANMKNEMFMTSNEAGRELKIFHSFKLIVKDDVIVREREMNAKNIWC